MNNSFARLIDGMCATLRSEVLTRLDDEFARGQVFGVINLLNTFKVRADWSGVFLGEQLKAQCEALQAVSTWLQAHQDALSRPADSAELSPANLDGSAPSVSVTSAPDVLSASDLLRMRDENNQQIDNILTWVDQHRTELGEEAVRQLEQPLRHALKREIELELKFSPRPLFAEMSSGKEN
jgi:hypothetical protein